MSSTNQTSASQWLGVIFLLLRTSVGGSVFLSTCRSLRAVTENTLLIGN